MYGVRSNGAKTSFGLGGRGGSSVKTASLSPISAAAFPSTSVCRTAVGPVSVSSSLFTFIKIILKLY